MIVRIYLPGLALLSLSLSPPPRSTFANPSKWTYMYKGSRCNYLSLTLIAHFCQKQN